MATLRVFTDANVLYASVVRDLVMELAKAGAVTLLWSEAVHDEWTTALLRNRPDLDKSRISRTRTLLTLAIPDAMVVNYEHRCAGIALPDSNDIHVLAAAIEGKAAAILTFNTAHFPVKCIARYKLGILHPDSLLLTLLTVSPELVVEAVATTRKRMRQPALSPRQFTDAMKRAHLTAAAAALEQYIHQL